jgi:hypothetical protein
MSFRVEYRTGVQATSDRIWEVVADLPGWTRWNPIFPEAGGVIAIGGALSLLERIDGRPERQIAARVQDWVPYAQLIWAERRGWHFNSVRFIEIEELAPGSCIVANGEIFSGFRGEDYLHKHRKTLRRACETMGQALRQHAEAP